MLRRLAAVAALSTLAILAVAPSAWARVEIDPGEAVAVATGAVTFSVEYGASAATGTTEDTTTTTASDLPGTTLEAEQRDDGNTSAAPWVIGSGIAALAAVGIGGWILKVHQDAEKAQSSGGAGGDGGGAPGDQHGS